MTRLEAIKIILTVVSGICWTVVYIEGIRVGFRDRYAESATQILSHQSQRWAVRHWRSRNT